MKAIVRIVLPVLALYLFCPGSARAQDQYLLMKPIQNAVTTGNFTEFKDICLDKISTTFEPPFDLSGYIDTGKFIEIFNRFFKHYNVTEVEWISKQIEDQFAIQSLELIIKNKRSEKTVYYKFIFFMTKIDKEWKIYYFRGLKL